MQRNRSAMGSSQTNRVADQFRDGYEAATECVSNNPASAMLITFSVGFGLGLALGYMLSEPPEEDHGRLARIGRHVLETMGQYMPDSLSKRLGA